MIVDDADADIAARRAEPGSPTKGLAAGSTSSSAYERRFRTSVTSSESTFPGRARLAIPRTRDEPCAADRRAPDTLGPLRFCSRHPQRSLAVKSTAGTGRDVAKIVA